SGWTSGYCAVTDRFVIVRRVTASPLARPAGRRINPRAIEKAAAAICRTYGWHAGSVIGHLVCQPGKTDPKGFTMDSMRARIARRLAAT
ncbi:hypothetical protein ACWCPC_37105, partial [Streptomyces decoyicus]